MTRLTFKEFSDANKKRCEHPRGFGRDVRTHTLAFVLGVGEEAGEVVGAYRAFMGISRGKLGITAADIGAEIADVVAYCDLLAQSLGLDLGEIVAEKFRRVSERIGYPVRARLKGRKAR